MNDWSSSKSTKTQPNQHHTLNVRKTSKIFFSMLCKMGIKYTHLIVNFSVRESHQKLKSVYYVDLNSKNLWTDNDSINFHVNMTVNDSRNNWRKISQAWLHLLQDGRANVFNSPHILTRTLACRGRDWFISQLMTEIFSSMFAENDKR